MEYLLGIDNGGTFSKAALFDVNGKSKASASCPTKLITPAPGFIERSMEDLWVSTAAVIKETITESGVDPAQIKGVSLSGHGKGLYIVGKQGEIIHNGVLSSDNRASSIVKRWYQDGTAEKVRKRTIQEILAVQPVSILAWLKENKPEIYNSIEQVFAVKDYIRFKLTGEAYGEYSDFSGANLINLTTKNYDRELMKLFGIEEIYNKLPPLKYSHEICGTITGEASIITGLNPGTPVAAGMFDVNACGIATGLTDPKTLVMIAGTWSINEYICEHPITNGSVALNSLYCIPEYYLIEESSPTSAGNLEWYIKTLMSDCECHEGIYNKVNNEVLSVDPKDTNLLFFPFLYGSNLHNQAKASFVGLTSYHTRAHMLRSIFEGVVFSHRIHLERLLKNRTAPEAIRLAGGAANSEPWVQIFADILQFPIEVVEEKELGALGAALAAGVGAGIFENYGEAVEKTLKINRVVYPRAEYKNHYNSKFRLFEETANSLNSIWEKFV